MTTNPTTVTIGDRVQITAAQPYNITWDDNGDEIIGEYGTLLHISPSAREDNERSGTYDSAPYQVRLDTGDTVWAADVMPETDGLRRTIAELDKSLDDRWQRIRALESQLAEAQAALAARPAMEDVAAWLVKKAREYPTAPERQESVPAAIARLASKVRRGAIR